MFNLSTIQVVRVSAKKSCCFDGALNTQHLHSVSNINWNAINSYTFTNQRHIVLFSLLASFESDIPVCISCLRVARSSHFTNLLFGVISNRVVILSFPQAAYIWYTVTMLKGGVLQFHTLLIFLGRPCKDDHFQCDNGRCIRNSHLYS